MSKATYLSIRIPTDLNARMLELRPYIENSPTYAPLGKISRVALFRMTLQRGVESLETELDVPADMLVEDDAIELDSDDEWGEATTTIRHSSTDELAPPPPSTSTAADMFSSDGWGFTVSDDGVIDATERPVSVADGRRDAMERLASLIEHLDTANELAQRVTKSIGAIIDLGGELSESQRALGGRLVELSKIMKREKSNLSEIRGQLEGEIDDVPPTTS